MFSDRHLEVSIELFKPALMCFGGGASLCALTFLFAYIAQLFFAGINSSETRYVGQQIYSDCWQSSALSLQSLCSASAYIWPRRPFLSPRLRQRVVRSRPHQRW